MYDNQEEFWETVISNAGNGKNCLKYNLVDLLRSEEHTSELQSPS